MVLFFYLTFAFLAVIGAVVLQFVFNPSARATDPDKNEFEVLTLPGSNTNCNVRPDPDTLQFCVMTWGCKDTCRRMTYRLFIYLLNPCTHFYASHYQCI